MFLSFLGSTDWFVRSPIPILLFKVPSELNCRVHMEPNCKNRD
jgi:hypothetical protein